MLLYKQIIDIVENDVPEDVALDVVKGGRKKAKSEGEEAITRFLRTYKPEERLAKQALLAQIESSPLYTEPANDVADSHKFGWNRGMALKLETIIRGRWSAWFTILDKQRFDEDLDDIPECEFSMFDGSAQVKKMLDRCMSHAYSSGYRGHDFMEWLGYSLGIAWFEKPDVDERTLQHWYDTFDISLMMLYPSDYLSTFLIDYQGQSGVGGYYPTPLNATMMINQMLGFGNPKIDRTVSVYEPCLGAGAMLLPSESLNLIGADFNISMVKAACIQAFLYQPWLLYIPHPITGIHFSESEMRINRYFEFSCDSNIFHGDSLLGEYRCPKEIFKESEELVDIHINPLDLRKNSALKWEKEFMTIPWDEMAYEMKWEIVKAQARSLGFDCVASNPPFGAMNKFTMEQIREYEKSNVAFLAERKAWLDQLEKTPSPHTEEIIDFTMSLIEEKTGQLSFF
ncbi:hypothetical protein [Paenibacillus abyssi]|uniref:DNA methylase adenine-specific domain-containing protein n=1 Tax=Paenibacillus abyssi TaxID=1340531 RepID=A0A917G1K6_9BACL|nr:hypothetical protein [Paenibacillus abyssi]GGG18227.1 hypothetical protein GCM10010916_38820 [Paenibacillus abyssi]